MENNLEKVKRYLGKAIPLSFENQDGQSDIFYFKPLNIEQQAILMELNRRIQKRPKSIVEGIEVPDVTKEDMIDMTGLFVDLVKNSMPELEDAIARDFVETNFENFMEQMEKLLPKNKNAKAIELIKERQKAN